MARKGPKMDSLLTVADFRKAAQKSLNRATWDYFRGGADSQYTLWANRAAFARRELLPRVLVDVSKIDTSLTLFGDVMQWPVLVAPMAYQMLAHKDGEAALARAAARAGSVYVASTLSTQPLEDIARASSGPKWFQLYVHEDRRITEALVHRAQNAGYRALVLTVDAPVLGRRLADVRNRFGLPRGMTMANLEPYGAARLAPAKGSALQELFLKRHDASFNWKDLGWLRSLTPLPIFLKGVLRADDARRAVESGVQGLIVSNHGGRQLDGAAPSLDCVAAVAKVVYGRCPVLMDGGVRQGGDILKALALGANAVLLGRPLLWGLAVGGEAGALRVFEIMRDEFTRALALCGCPDLGAVTQDLLVSAASHP